MNVDESEKIIAWGVRTNTDLTEGKGEEYFEIFCRLKETAIRLGHKRYIMGSDCPIEQVTLHKINNKWYGPVRVNYGNNQDIALNNARLKYEDTISKMMEAGIDEQTINNFVDYDLVKKGLK